MTLQELKHIAPRLAQTQKKGSGFKIPDTYFDKFENVISDRLFIDSLPKASGYNTPTDYFKEVENHIISKTDNKITTKQAIPDGYFDTVEDNVFERLAFEKQPKVFFLSKYWMPVAVAASLLVLVSIYNPFTHKQNLEVAEIEAWIEEGNLYMDSYEIAELYHDEIDNITIENTLNINNLEEYLNNQISEEFFYN